MHDDDADALMEIIVGETRTFVAAQIAALRAELMHRIGAVESGLASSLDATLAATEKALGSGSEGSSTVAKLDTLERRASRHADHLARIESRLQAVEQRGQ